MKWYVTFVTRKKSDRNVRNNEEVSSEHWAILGVEEGGGGGLHLFTACTNRGTCLTAVTVSYLYRPRLWPIYSAPQCRVISDGLPDLVMMGWNASSSDLESIEHLDVPQWPTSQKKKKWMGCQTMPGWWPAWVEAAELLWLWLSAKL